jgi:thiol-disulfide isomerase/thioredoxin
MNEITSFDELISAIDENDVLVIDLFATWCVPCQQMLPVVEELSELYDFPFYKVDIDRVPQVKDFTGAKAVPMIIIYKGKRKREFVFGIVDSKKIKSKIERVLKLQ